MPKTAGFLTSYFTFAKDSRHVPADKRETSGITWTNFKRYGNILFSWSIYYFAYYGLQYSMNWMGNIILLNFTLFGIIELIGIYMGTRLLKEFKVFVMPMRLLLFFGGLACLVFRDQSSTSFFLAVLCGLNSRQTGHHPLLPAADDLHHGVFPHQEPLPGLHSLLLRWEVQHSRDASDPRVHQRQKL
jgi:hypothetical protein